MKATIELRLDGKLVKTLQDKGGLFSTLLAGANTPRIPRTPAAKPATPTAKAAPKARKKAPPKTAKRVAAKAKAAPAGKVTDAYLEKIASKLTAEPRRAEELKLPGDSVTARRALAKLVEGGVAVKEGKARGTTYRLAS